MNNDLTKELLNVSSLNPFAPFAPDGRTQMFSPELKAAMKNQQPSFVTNIVNEVTAEFKEKTRAEYPELGLSVIEPNYNVPVSINNLFRTSMFINLPADGGVPNKQRVVHIGNERYDNGETIVVVFENNPSTLEATSTTRHYQSPTYMTSKELAVSNVTCRDENTLHLDIFEFLRSSKIPGVPSK